MTIIVGFTCHDALVIASDSQATFSPSTFKQPDIQKVFPVPLGDMWDKITSAKISEISQTTMATMQAILKKEAQKNFESLKIFRLSDEAAATPPPSKS